MIEHFIYTLAKITAARSHDARGAQYLNGLLARAHGSRWYGRTFNKRKSDLKSHIKLYMHIHIRVCSNKWKFQVAIACGDVARRRGRCERDRARFDCCCLFISSVSKNQMPAKRANRSIEMCVCVFTRSYARELSVSFSLMNLCVHILYN